jgi:UDP-2,4-diacetamido-2,4,6-trideoxy-beta-L-altropyranose hydrolase
VTPLIVFLCAATATTGAGHLGRCLALAGVYRKAGWHIEFIVTGDAFAHLLAPDYSWQVAANGQTIEVLGTIAPNGCDILVIDDYSKDEPFETACAALARRIVILDDQSGHRHRCDVLIDAAITDAAVYRGLVGNATRILAGPKYALIGSGIVRHRRAAVAARSDRKVSNILLSFGATDPEGLTPRVLDAIAEALPDRITLTVALSSRAPGIETIRALSSDRIRLVIDPNMGELISAADIAIGAAGVGAFERAALGLPGIIVTAAENQKGVARLLVEAGASLDGGNADQDLAARLVRQVDTLVNDAELRGAMASAAALLVDGRAADRIHLACAAAVKLEAGAGVRLRAAEFDDADWLLELQREPATRRFARNPAPPTQQQHARWLASILENGSSVLAIVEVDGAAAGMLRLDLSDQAAAKQVRYEVSIAVGTAFHGRGIGSTALRLIRELYPAAIFDAFVLPENATSLRMFLRAGYIDAGNGFYRSVPREQVPEK